MLSVQDSIYGWGFRLVGVGVYAFGFSVQVLRVWLDILSSFRVFRPSEGQSLACSYSAGCLRLL